MSVPYYRVWLVGESVSESGNPICAIPQDCYVIALTATEAAQIVAETDTRRIVRVEEVCPITQLPGDRYRVQPWKEAQP